MPHVEETSFDIHLALRCAFPDDYDGDADGYAWKEEVGPLAAEIVRAIVQTVARHQGWSIRPGNRGRSTADEVMLVLDKQP